MDDFERDWRNVIEQLDARRQEYRSVLDGDASMKREAARSYWQAVALVCHCYNRPGNWPGGAASDVRDAPAPRFAFPPTLARVLGNQAQYLHVGNVNAMLTDVAGKGRASPGPHEKRDMAVAVAYVAAVRAGDIALNAPIKSVAQAFGIKVRTLQKWIQEMTWVSKGDFGAPAKLQAQFESSANNYRAAGRSASAVGARGSRRASY